MRILGIDAGFTALGAVVYEAGAIIHAATCRTQATARKRGVRVADDNAERCQTLARFLIDIIKEYQPAGAVIELPVGGARSAKAAWSMGMATGVVATVLEATGLPAEWVTPMMVKKAAADRKDASKEQVAFGVISRFDWQIDPPLFSRPKADAEHITDAAGALLAAEHGTLMRMAAQKGA